MYAVAAWAIIQVSDTVLPRLGLPEWSVTLVIVLVLLGAPLALIMAWAFDVGPDGVTRTDDATSSPPPSGWSAARFAVVGAVVVLAGVGIAFYTKGRASDLPADRVAVATFENRTNDPALSQIGRMTADFIIRGLTESGQINVAGTPGDLNAEDKKSSTDDQIRLLAHKYNAGVVVTGSLYREGDSVLIVAQVTNAREGKLLRTIGPVSYGATSSKSLDGVERMRQLATGGVIALVSPAAQGFFSIAEASHLPTWDAYRLYLQGANAFTARAFDKSAEAFYKSYEADTLFLLPRIRELYALSNMRATERIDSIAEWFEPRRERLTQFEVAYLDRILARTHGDQAGTYRASHEMMRLRPKSANAIYLAGRDAIPVNRMAEAVKLISKLDPNDPELPVGSDVERDLAVALHMLGKYRASLKAADAAMQRAGGQVEAIGMKIANLAALDRLDEINRLADEVELEANSKLTQPPGAILSNASNELLVHGHPAEARIMAGRAAAWYLAHDGAIGPTVHALLRSGDVREAAAVLDTAAAKDTTLLLSTRALVAIAQGDRKKAQQMDAQIASRPRGPADERGNRQLLRARIAATLGEKERAVRFLREAIANGAPFGIAMHGDPMLHVLAGYKPYDDLMKPRD